MVADFVVERIFMLIEGKCSQVYFKKDSRLLMEKLEFISKAYDLQFEVVPEEESYKVSIYKEV